MSRARRGDGVVRRILLGGRRGRESAVAIVAALACCGPGAALAQTPSVAIRPPDPGTTVGGVVKDIADAARPVTDAAGQAAGAAANTTAAATTGPLTDTLQQATAGTAPPAGGAHGSPARDAAPAPEHVTPQPGDDRPNVPGAAT